MVPPLKIKSDWFTGLDSNGLSAVYSLHSQTADPSSPTSRKLFQYNDEEQDPDQGVDPEEDPRYKRENEDYLDVDTPDNDEQQEKYFEKDPIFGKEAIMKGIEGTLPQEGVESFELFLTTDTPSTYVAQMGNDLNPLKSQFKADHRYLWRLNNSIEGEGSGYILLDAHILATPVIADLDNDGSDEIIVSVSYYYDYNDYYNNPNIEQFDDDDDQPKTKKQKRSLDIDVEKYVAGGIIVWNIDTQRLLFNLPLDLTRDDTQYRGHIYVSPTVADIDRDGYLEIVVGTGVGFIYVIDHNGKLRLNGFPVQMDSVYAPVLLLDVNNDKYLDLIVTDINSNIAAWSGRNGEELWTNRLSGVVNQEISVTDYNKDGQLELIMSTDMGHLWGFYAKTGEVVDNFPINLKSAIYAQPLVIDLTVKDGSKQKFIITNTVGGKLILLSPTYKGGCIDEIDLGEPSYAMVLADDLNSNRRNRTYCLNQRRICLLFWNRFRDSWK